MENPRDTVQISHEDEQIIVCVKPVGLGSERDMPAALSEQTGAGTVLAVHRLDTAVGGMMVYAKDRVSAARLSAAITRGEMEKRYLAVCSGEPDPPAGEMRDLLFQDARNNKSFVVTRMRKGVREAALKYRVLDTREGISLVLVRLETGRSHQIRVQFASRRHPLLGDGKYGSTVKGCTIALWSHCLAFPHPATGKTVAFSCAPPEKWPWTVFDRAELSIER